MPPMRIELISWDGPELQCCWSCYETHVLTVKLRGRTQAMLGLPVEHTEPNIEYIPKFWQRLVHAMEIHGVRVVKDFVP